MSFLDEILARTREAVRKRQSERSLSSIQAAVPMRSDDRRFLRAIQQPGVSVIAEFKRRSPSEGVLAGSPDLSAFLSAYERGGAAAVSVLTEQTAFDGSLADLRTGRSICSLPILCKDFIVEEYQVHEAAEAGADAVLLIAAALTDQGLMRHLHDVARNLHLDVLIEVRNEQELEQAGTVTSELLGINNRDLAPSPPQVDKNRTRDLVRLMPEGATVVSESGIESPGELPDLAMQGIAAVLIGTSLMKSDDPEERCRAFSVAGRAQTTSRLPAAYA
jgi:indole-3-glycerol phosphate synthase